METTESKVPISQPTLEPLAVDPDGVRALLGSKRISSVTLWRMEKEGRLKRVPGMRQRLYTIASVRALVAGKGAA
jgi:hypothetical protein